ncbi:unnamed protein product [Eruca vesicaria subsp. sativa]|uniref:Leucine-rich repeat-containing N-terminal plant-type domain-containing protein n=1 Tax=Eruca vesicaria subsp. sativa TaxID=29727 RepID=A0ABC8KQM6_ERUVS|nr:unnamed protein product [Eruca vesicaria subsp. sativa]
MWRFFFLMHGYRGCLEKERKALLDLKAFLISVDPFVILDWPNNRSISCCRWERIKCDAKSRRVTGLSLKLQSLNLSGALFGGWSDNIEGYKSFRKLPKLEILDLSRSGFNINMLPFLPSVTSLKTLILRFNYWQGGFLMKELSNLTNLEVLDLSDNFFNDTLPSLGLADLHKLKAVDLSNNQFSGSLQGICKLRTLQELDIRRNVFEGQLPSCLASFTKLRVLDLSSNNFNGSPPNVISNLKSLEYLSLSNNNYEGIFSYSSIKDLSKLKVLKLSSMSDKLHIDMESSLQPQFQLLVLELRGSNIEKLPSFLWYQTELRLIDISNNKLSGPFPTWILENNTQLEVLYLQYNALHTLQVPRLVHTLRLLDLSANNFSDKLSDDFGSILSSLRQINLSGNKFKGSLPASVGEIKNIHALDLSHNDFSGKLPRSLFMGCHFLRRLTLSHNKFDGQVFPESTNLTSLMMLLVDNNMFTGNFGNGILNSSRLNLLDMSNNFLTGTIPSWMGRFDWNVLSMSKNLLEGTIPSNLFHSPTLELVDLSRNNLSGTITSRFSNISLPWGMLYLNDNFLTGTLSETLLENLMVLDVRNNKLSGSIPVFINANSVRVLLLRGNDLTGSIPLQLCSLNRTRVLDLSHNRLNESIPPCLSNLSFGVKDSVGSSFLGGITPYMDHDMGTYYDSILNLDQIAPEYTYGLNYSVMFAAKQRYDSYFGSGLRYIFGLDLSNNELSGPIPEELGHLERARSLNLSHNSLVGSIPESFSNLKDIESLDLSFNNLHGPVPIPLTELNSLAVFNVSYNNLSGLVPRGKQFNTFGEDSYFSNPFLCGLPTDRSCDKNSTKELDQESLDVDSETKFDVVSFCWSLGVTYAMVLLGFFFFVCFDSPWRQRWFLFVDAFVRLFHIT